LWQELASGEVGVAQPLVLEELVCRLADLLKTQITTRRLELVMRELEPATVQADRRQLLRDLLRGFLHAFAAAGPGGAVVVPVRGGPSQGRAILTPEPSPGSAEVTPAALTLSYPRTPGQPTEGAL
jgi:hypothetical protein